jgi:hypothetical protein
VCVASCCGAVVCESGCAHNAPAETRLRHAQAMPGIGQLELDTPADQRWQTCGGPTGRVQDDDRSIRIKARDEADGGAYRGPVGLRPRYLRRRRVPPLWDWLVWVRAWASEG